MLTDGESADGERADAGADEFEHVAADGFQHAAHLAIAAFGDGDFDEAFGAIAEAMDVGGARGSVAEFDALAELVELLAGEDGGGFDEVGFGDVEFGIGEAFGELGVVGHQEEAGGVEVEPADGGEEGADVFQQVVDGGAAFGILKGGEVAFGLVEQQIEGLGDLERAAVEGDFVAREVDPLIGILGEAAVDVDAAGVDPGAGLRAGAEAGFGEHAFESFLRQVPMLAYCVPCHTVMRGTG
jgi:hypothetical protein